MNKFVLGLFIFCLTISTASAEGFSTSFVRNTSITIPAPASYNTGSSGYSFTTNGNTSAGRTTYSRNNTTGFTTSSPPNTVIAQTPMYQRNRPPQQMQPAPQATTRKFITSCNGMAHYDKNGNIIRCN